MVDIFYGRAGSGKTFSLMNEIKSVTQNGTSVFLIVPEQLSLTREFLVNSEGIKNVSVLSFTRFANTVFRTLGGTAKKHPDKAMQTAAVFLAIENVYDRLVYFKSTAFTDGFISALISAFSEFDTNCMSAEAIMKIPDAQWSVAAKNKYRDMFLIYSEYKKMWSDEYKDPSGDIVEAAGLLELNDIYTDTVFAFDGFFGFTAQQVLLINQLTRQSPRCIFSFTTDMQSDIFKTVTAEVNNLKRECQKNGAEVNFYYVGGKNYKAKSEGLAVAEKNAFELCTKKSDSTYDGISVYSAKNINDELNYIACKIKNDALNKKYRYRDIAVICPDVSEIRFVISSVFEKHGVPAFIDTGRTLASQPLCAFVAAALDIARFGFEAQYVFRLLKTGLAGVEFDDISLLESYIRLWRLKNRHWNDEPWLKNPNGIDSYEREPDQNRLDKINELRFYVQRPLENFKKSVSGTTDVKQILTAIYTLTEEFSVKENLIKTAQQFLASGDTMLYSEYTRVYGVFIDMLDSIFEMCHGRKMNAKRFYDMFLACATNCSVSTRPSNIDEVEVLSLGQARAEAKKCVYIPRLNSKYLPSSSSSSSLITEADKRVFLQNDITVSMDAVTRSAREYFDFYCAVTTPTDELCLSFSTFAVTGEKQPPSQYLDSIMTAVNVKPITENNLPPEFFLVSVAGAGEYGSKTDDSEMIDAVFEIKGYKKVEKNHDGTKLSDEVVDALYGRHLKLSFSGMEDFVSCPFSFFMNRGLRVRKTEPVDFASSDIGTFIHKGLENLLKDDYDISTPLAVDDAVKKIADDYMQNQLADCVGSGKRFDFLFTRASDALLSACQNVADEIRNSDFKPRDFELDIQGSKFELDNGKDLTLTGSIDRVDMTDDGLIKIVDYKSGKQQFSYKFMYNGLSLQLPIYAHAAKEKYKDGQIAAMHYLKVGVPVCDKLSHEGMSDIEYAEKLESFYKRDGVIGNQENLPCRLDNRGKLFAKIKKDRQLTPKEMDKLINFAVDKIVAAGKAIANGVTEASPIQASDKDSCKYCDFSSVCGFDCSGKQPRKFEAPPKDFIKEK